LKAVKYAQLALLQSTLDPLNARSVMQDSTKSTEPLVTLVPLAPLLSLDHLAWILVTHAPLAPSRSILDLQIARSVTQDSMKSTEPLVTLVPLALLLWLEHLV